MPLIQVDMFEGRSDEQVQAYVQALTDTTCRLLGCTPEDVTIIFRDVPRSRWATGGALWTKPPAV
jgi:4-oxalocrotonate tautomerase